MMAAMEDLHITLVQAATIWHDAAGNRKLYADIARPLKNQTHLVVLPETFTSGFTDDILLSAETMQGQTVSWMAELAAEIGAVIVGSIVVRDNEKIFNRLIWMRPDASFAYYDKRHLFRMAGEHLRYASGSQRLIVELNGWRICPMVCYDLRFPVWIRNRYHPIPNHHFDYDLAVFVANWPEPRRGAWCTLLRARAIENFCYVAGVNRVGIDGKQLHYAGDSALIDFLGETMIDLGDRPQVVTTVLSAEALISHRERFPSWMDADNFTLHL